MQKIPGKRANTSRYVFEGYEYHIDTTSPTIYRCATRATTGCRGTVRVDEHGRVTVHKPHEGHGANPTLMQEAEMRREMLILATRTNDSFKHIFDAVCSRHPDMAAQFSYSSMKAAMQRARRENRPVIPENLRDLAIILNTYAPTQQMYRGIVEADDGSVALLFASQQILLALAAAHEIYIDGTFKVAPYHPPVAQLYTVHIRIMDTGIVAVYALCSAKTRALYSAIFSKISDLAPNLIGNLQFVLGDYEQAAMGAIREVFPGATIHGYWFHFNQALLRRWRRYETRNSWILPMAMALPLAPSDRFEEGLDVLAQMAVAEGGGIGFVEWLREQWGPLARVVNVWKCTIRTNKLLEKFHDEAKPKLGGLHLTVWKFLEHLVELILKEERNLQRLQNRDRARRPQTRSSIHQDLLFRDAQHDLSVGRYSLREFLRRCATRTIRVQVGRDDGEELAEVDPALMAAGDAVLEEPNVAELVDPAVMDPADAVLEEPNVAELVDPAVMDPADAVLEEPNVAELVDPAVMDPADAVLEEPNVAELVDPAVMDPADAVLEEPNQRGGRRGRGPRPGAVRAVNAPLVPQDGDRGRGRRNRQISPLRPAVAEPDIDEAESSDDDILPGTCRVCLLAMASHAFIPCGHRCCCAACAERITVRCPLCRTDFTAVCRIHI